MILDIVTELDCCGLYPDEHCDDCGQCPGWHEGDCETAQPYSPDRYADRAPKLIPNRMEV